jgi:hypothetical protein
MGWGAVPSTQADLPGHHSGPGPLGHFLWVSLFNPLITAVQPKKLRPREGKHLPRVAQLTTGIKTCTLVHHDDRWLLGVLCCCEPRCHFDITDPTSRVLPSLLWDQEWLDHQMVGPNLSWQG